MSQVGTAEDVLQELRRHRASKRSRPRGWELIAWAQVVVLLVAYAAFGLWLLVGGPPITGEALTLVRTRGPAAAGLAVALLAALSMRSGLRGGPLAVEQADVHLLLLAPVTRRAVLLPIAVRQLLRMAGIGLVTGGICGLLTAARLPGGLGPWIAGGASVGALTGTMAVAPGMVVSGRRLRLRWVSLVSLLVLAGGCADLLAGTRVTPATWFGSIALWPLDPAPVAIAALPLTVLVAAAALASVPGTSIEALDRRSGVMSELRFAASTRDVRALTRAGHRLAEEVPRVRPWLRLPDPGRRSHPVWRRDWHSLLRWPLGRLGRVAAMALGIAGALALTWAGASYFLVIAGALAYAVGLEVLEPWSQEVERPDLTDSLPAGRLSLLARHLPSAVAAESIVALVVLAALLSLRPSPSLLAAAALLVVPAATAAVCGASLRGSPEGGLSAMPQDELGIAAFSIVLRTAGPPSVAILGLVPVLILRDGVESGRDPIGLALAGGAAVLIGSLVVLALSRSRELLLGTP